MEIVLKMRGLENHPVYRLNLKGKYHHLRWHEVLSVINRLKEEDFVETDEVYMILLSAHLEHSSFANIIAKELIEKMRALKLPQVLIYSVIKAIETGAASILHVVELLFLHGQSGTPIQYHEILERHKPSMEEFYSASNLICFSSSHLRFVRAIFRVNVLRGTGSELSYSSKILDHIKSTFVEEVAALSNTQAEGGPVLSVVETVSVSTKGSITALLQLNMIRLKISIGEMDRTVLIINSDASSRLTVRAEPSAGDPPSFWDGATQKFIEERVCIDRSSTNGTWLLFLRLLLCKIPERFGHKHAGYRGLVTFDGKVL